MATSSQLTNKSAGNTIHLSYLDGLRALAAIYVVIHHEQIRIEGRQEPLLKKLIDAPFWYGHYAVDLFIVLSGFCLMLPVVRNGGRLKGTAWQFIARRAQRILPPYYLAMGLSLVLIATLIGQKTGSSWDASLPVTPFAVYTHLLLVHDFFVESFTRINTPLWSIAVEWRIYLLFPLLLLAWQRWGGLPIALLTAAISIGVWFALLDANLPGFNTTKAGFCPHYLGLFAFGMLAAELSFSTQARYHRLREQLPWLWLVAASSVAIALLTHYKAHFPWMYADIMVGIWAACLLVAVSVGQAERLRRVLSWRPLAFVGTFSFSIYLIHFPLYQLFLQYVVWPLGLGLVETTVFLLVVGTPVIVLVAYGFYWLAERPFIPSTSKSLVAKERPLVANGV